ncbi:aldo/keto reductase [Chloroherpeton thalassium ATCC 35110]|uniref:Aldo/keto reductase n=1 Tax=Chloroherpeton thalassium (strain ATCC 35110 / GB-78) TaxID=517418 RepID=B3QXG7_CHLT3|nr:aldo/keto reductase [Chloroherpeton thalassium]ACF13441.1 aldo/keto reductase [Chloroherpeton thalassium ATCC 35110]
MKYKLLGKSGLRVSEICLGTMTFGEEWGWGASKAESKKMFDAYAHAGGNFIDTANLYTNGSSEKFVGEFISSASDRAHFVLATKYSLATRKGDPNACGNHRKNLVQAIDASLERLGTDYIDLYWLHAWDFLTPVEEVMRGLDDLVRAGKVLYIGISDTPAWVVSRANMLAELRGWTPFVALQIEYSLIERSAERELLPMARELDLAVTPWAPLGAGLLTGKYTRGNAFPNGTRLKENSPKLNERNLKIAAAVDKVADEIGCSSSQVALNWLRAQAGVVVPIVGATNESQLKENLNCLNDELSKEQLTKLNQAAEIDLGFPHEFLQRPHIQEIIYGCTYEQIENHRARHS